MKKYTTLFLTLILILSFSSCGAKSDEKENEKYDISLMDAVETNAMNLWLTGQDKYPDLCAKLASEGLYYDPESDTLTDEKPEAGYGKGTAANGEESWTYYCGCENGQPVTKTYDSTKDYTGCCLKAFYDEAADLYYYDWEEVK